MTKRFAGQIVRLIGLAVEVLGILAQALRSGTDSHGAPLPGHFSSRQIWTGVGAGFVMWLVGTILIYWPTLPAKPRPRGNR